MKKHIMTVMWIIIALFSIVGLAGWTTMALVLDLEKIYQLQIAYGISMLASAIALSYRTWRWLTN